MPFKADLNELSLAALSNWPLIMVSTFFDKAKRPKSQMRQGEVNFIRIIFDKDNDNKTFI